MEYCSTLNRFLTHEDGHTSYFRRWKHDYQGALCEFGETVLFRTPGKPKNKADIAWYTRNWLGRDTEADESIVYCEGAVHKVRAVKRVIPSKQWNTELHKSLNSTPFRHWFRTSAFNGCLWLCGSTTWTGAWGPRKRRLTMPLLPESPGSSGSFFTFLCFFFFFFFFLSFLPPTAFFSSSIIFFPPFFSFFFRLSFGPGPCCAACASNMSPGPFEFIFFLIHLLLTTRNQWGHWNDRTLMLDS